MFSLETGHERMLNFVTNNSNPPCGTLAFEPGMVNWISLREIVLVEEGLLALFDL